MLKFGPFWTILQSQIFPCKILEPYDNPFWDFSNGGEKKKRLIPKIVAYLVARTLLGPNFCQVPRYRGIFFFAWILDWNWFSTTRIKYINYLRFIFLLCHLSWMMNGQYFNKYQSDLALRIYKKYKPLLECKVLSFVSNIYLNSIKKLLWKVNAYQGSKF